MRVFVCLSKQISPACQTAYDHHPLGQIVTATEAQLVSQCATYDIDISPEFIRNAIQSGHFCFALMRDNRVAGHCWISDCPTVVIDRVAVIPPSQSLYVYKAYTDPAYRGGGVLGTCLAAAARAAVDRSSNELVTLVERGNLRSLRAFQRWGFRRIGYAVASRRSGRTLRSRGCRQHGIAFRPVPDSTSAMEICSGTTD